MTVRGGTLGGLDFTQSGSQIEVDLHDLGTGLISSTDMTDQVFIYSRFEGDKKIYFTSGGNTYSATITEIDNLPF